MRKITTLAAALAVAPILAFATPALASVLSSVEGGDIYRVKNVTKNVDFTDPATADACDVLQYKVRIHNPGPTDTLNNVTVSAAFGTAATTKNVSIVTVRSDNASPSSTSDTATVNLSSSQTMSYINGTTQLLDANGNGMQTLPDGITGNGVSIGSVGVSIGNKRFVQFEEKVNCPTPTTTTTTPTPQVKSVTTLPNTGAGDVVGIFAGASAAGTAAHAVITRRRKN